MHHEYSQLCAIPSVADVMHGKGDTRWLTPPLRSLAAHMLWMPSIHRDALSAPETDLETSALILAQAKDRTVGKLRHMRLTLPHYFRAYDAFGSGNIDELQRIDAESHRRIEPADEQPDTKTLMTDPAGRYTLERRQLHWEYVHASQQGIRSSHFPVLRIVMGPFGAGKSEKLRALYQNTEPIYVSDPDAVRPYLMDDFDASNHTHVMRTSREVADLSDLAFNVALGKRLSILCETSLRHLDWWKKMVHRVNRIGYRVELHMAARAIQDCFRRVIASRDRPARIGDYLNLTERYKNFMALVDHPGVSTVTLTGMASPEGMRPEDCPLTGDYIRAMQQHPKVNALTM